MWELTTSLKVGTPKPPLFATVPTVVTIIRLGQIFNDFFVSECKDVPTHQRTQQLGTVCKGYEESKLFLVDVPKSFLQHIYILILKM